MAYSRYQYLNRNGEILRTPHITLNEKSTDYYVVYKRGSSRLDNLSYDYYGDPSYGWLILLANQNVADLEFNIPDNTVIRIPYPLTDTLEEYGNKIEAYDRLYGLA